MDAAMQLAGPPAAEPRGGGGEGPAADPEEDPIEEVEADEPGAPGEAPPSPSRGPGAGEGAEAPAAAPAAPGGRKASAYLAFAGEARAGVVEALRAEGTGKPGVAAVGRALGDKWRALGAEEKAAYQALADRQAARKKALGPAGPVGAGPGKAKKMKKKAPSAYLAFANAHRAAAKAELEEANPGEKFGVAAVAKAIGAKWQGLTEEGKAQYKEMAAAQAAEKAALAGSDSEGEEAPEPDRPTGFPLSVVRRLVEQDPDVKRVSAEAVKAVARATELYLEMLAADAYEMARLSNRRTLKFEDLHRASRNKARNFMLTEHLLFVKDGIMNAGPAATAGGEKENAGPGAGPGGKRKGAPEAAQPGTKRITAFFGAGPTKYVEAPPEAARAAAGAGGAKAKPAGIRAAFARAAPPRRTARVIEEDDED